MYSLKNQSVRLALVLAAKNLCGVARRICVSIFESLMWVDVGTRDVAACFGPPLLFLCFSFASTTATTSPN